MKKIITADEVKVLTGMQNLVINSVFENTINSIFRKYFKVILQEYYDDINTKLSNDESFTNEENDIISNLSLSLSFYILSENILSLGVKIGKNGINMANNSEYQTLNVSDIKILQNEYKNKAEDYKKEFVDYMNTIYFINNDLSVSENRNRGGFVIPPSYRYNSYNDYYKRRR